MAATQQAPAAGGGLMRFMVPAQAPPKPSRQVILDKIVQLLREKGAPAIAQIQQKVKMGQGFVVKGCEVDTGVLREALAQVEGAKPTQPPAVGQCSSKVATGTPAPAVAAASAESARAVAGTMNRWFVGAPSASALAQKALQECESAEPFVRTVKNVGTDKVAILVKPNISSHATGGHIAPGDVFDVIARSARIQDGRTYLRLKQSEGWVSTRAHGNLFKIVLVSAENGATIEPVGCPTTFQSKAAQVLPFVNAAGRHMDREGRFLEGSDAVAAAQKEPRTFRVAGGRGQSILSHPSAAGSPVGIVQASQEFQANAICVVPAEGRAYLHLKDGRGWVCERVKADFCRYAVEPVGFSVQQDGSERAAAARRAVSGHVKTSVVERPGLDVDEKAQQAAALAAVAARAKASRRCTALKDEAVVLRSDSELWPKVLGEPRPIKGEMRTALRRHSRFFYRKVKDCQDDLDEVERKVESYGRACDGKKVLQTHVDVLKKEIAKIEQEWKAAIEKDIASVDVAPASKRSLDTDRCAVAPVQVLGEAWHCAVVRADQDDGEGGKSSRQFLGPLRADAVVASEDLQRLSAAVSKSVDADEDLSPAAKKKRPPAQEDVPPSAKKNRVSGDVD